MLSEELVDKEEEESDARVSEVDHLIPIMYAYAHAMAEGLVSHQREHLTDEEQEGIPSQAWHATQKVFTQVAMNSLLGTVSQLVDMGMLTVPRRKK